MIRKREMGAVEQKEKRKEGEGGLGRKKERKRKIHPFLLLALQALHPRPDTVPSHAR